MSQTVKLPGFGIPLNGCRYWRASPGDGFITNRENDDPWLFRNVLDLVDIDGGYSCMRLTPVREFEMVQIMNEITDKPNWETQVFDSNITDKWRAKAAKGADDMEKMLDWVIAELQYRSKHFKESGMVMACDEGVVKSDSAIPASLKESLKVAAARLENVPEAKKVYRPYSSDKVLDLVHPSLFPLVYGRTRIITDSILGIDDGVFKSGAGEVLPVPAEDEPDLKDIHPAVSPRDDMMSHPYSGKFQWLPCDVAFTSANSSTATDSTTKSYNECTITSYVNNLHPTEHRELYGILERVISRAIPLWNMTLTSTKSRMAGCIYKRISFDGPPEIFVGCPGGLIDGEKPDFVDDLEEDSDLYQEIMEESEWNSTELIPPEPGLFTPPEEVSPEVDAKNSLSGRETVDLQRDYEKTGLQVIVKLSNIHLTPEKPSYEGGSWHAEGQLNEHICATALYYYDRTNITESRLAYRHIGDSSDLDDIEYEEEDHYWLEEIFGCEEHGPSMQEIGNVACKEGRLLTFPNILQHRVEPFNLKIPTKPGHLKILALFLVDPNLRIISTANVPSQRADWRAESVSWGGVLEKLPRELFDEVLSHLDDFPMSMEEAKELRLELMEERKASMVHQENAISRRHFFLREPE